MFVYNEAMVLSFRSTEVFFANNQFNNEHLAKLNKID